MHIRTAHTTGILDSLIRFRWLIALFVFILAVGLRLHMSSIGQFNLIFPTMSDGDSFREIIGISRAIRQDEWAVQAPTYFSQAYNGYAMNSFQQSLGGINMVLDYFAPVLDLTLIGKPFNWGYVFFGNEIGLSWYWSLFVILLFMSAFEMFWILTKKNRLLSFVGCLMIGFSPAVQWWMMPHMPIVFLYGMALFDIGYYFFTSKSIWFSWILTVLGVIGFTGFALSIFPSLQIIVGIISLVLLVVCLYRDREEITFRIRSIRLLQLGIMILMTGIIIGRFLLTNVDALKLLLNTAYPGKRVSTGGENGIASLLPTLYTIILPFKGCNITNNSEISTFIHFSPFVLLLYPLISRRMKKEHDAMLGVGTALMVLLLIEIVFMCIGFTEIQAVITLFSYNNRMPISYGFTSVIFTVWGMYAFWKYPDLLSKKQKMLFPVLFGLFYLTLIDDALVECCGKKLLLIEILIFTLMVVFTVYARRKTSAVLISGFMIAMGGFVNPLCSGIGAITDHPVSEMIAEIREKEPDALWMTLGDRSGVTGNFVAANGARVLTGTNFYPDYEKWEILDPEGEQDPVYNRYANQYAFLTENETRFENPAADTINMYLTPSDLEKLGVTYLLSDQAETEEILASAGVRFDIIGGQDGYTIYHLSQEAN